MVLSFASSPAIVPCGGDPNCFDVVAFVNGKYLKDLPMDDSNCFYSTLFICNKVNWFFHLKPTQIPRFIQ